ncbi:MAG: hypothetical protein IJX49_06860 [Clostridia bacterium]|nr:hypothetical protein [Clostridia bacterium]
MNHRIKLKMWIAALVFLLMVAAMLGLGFERNKAFLAKAEEKEVKEVTVTGVQLRAEVSSDFYYLVLLTNEHAQIEAGISVSETATYVNLLSGVKLYTSENDETGVSAADICKADGWVINKWGSGGLMIPMTAEDYETYSGSSVYKISVAKDIILPCEEIDLKVIEDVTYVNQSYGNEANKYGAFVWMKEIPILPDMEVEITGVQLRGNVEAGAFYFVILAEPYSALSSSMTVENPENYSELLEGITFYMSDLDEVGVSAAEICSDKDWLMNHWISEGLMFPISAENYETYNGSSVYKISLNAELVLPYVNTNLKTSEAVTYLNNGYGFDEYKIESFSWSKDMTEGGAISVEDMNITGVQLRAEPGSGLYYFVVTADNYIGVEFGAWVAQTGRFPDLLSKIRLYTSEEDTIGVSAAEICKSTEWVMNKWDSHGVMFPMTAENYALYNGTTVYKVKIEGDTVFPGNGCNLVLYEECVYLNSTYGKEESRDSGYYWSAVPSVIYDFGTCTLTDMNNRASSTTGERWLFLFFAETFETTQDVSGWLKQLNTLDYIEFYPTEDLTQEPISLRDVYTGFTVLKQFGQNTAMTFTIQPEYSGAQMYMLRVKPGCQIPYIINGECGYRVLENGKSFTNDKYGLTGDIFGVFDEMGMARTYENWGIWWTPVRQVSFTVKGLDNVSYPSRIVAAGDIIDLKDFAVEGYDVALTTGDGERCIGGYIVPDKDVELILTYTLAQEEKKSGCGSVTSIGLLPISVAALAFLLKKKKEDE